MYSPIRLALDEHKFDSFGQHTPLSPPFALDVLMDLRCMRIYVHHNHAVVVFRVHAATR